MPNVTPRSVPPQAFDALIQHGLHPVLARIYAARGIAEPEQLETELSLLIPFERLKNITAMATLLALTCCSKTSAQTSTVDLKLDVKAPLRFVAYGDTRFHDPKDFEAANPPVRVALVQAIADANPAFVCFTGGCDHEHLRGLSCAGAGRERPPGLAQGRCRPGV